MQGDPAHGQKAGVDAHKRPPVVLVIDDDDIGRTLICETLRSSFPVLLESSSPIGASRIVIQEHVDVTVLDLEMPNLPGNKLAKLFRDNPKLAYVGIVLVSACGGDELFAIGESCGADGVVTKHDLTKALPSMVGKALRMSWTRRAGTGAATRHAAAALPAAGPQRSGGGQGED